ncbi:hypothetical protein MMC16_000381 [Acarospora aff. strigata]|nr:hypothetical protein [Acarospora aff. strigata]
MALADGPKNIREKVHVDVEATVVPIAESVGFSASLDANLVTWNGPDDPENPKNWSTGKRWTATLIVSSFTFLSPLSGTMISPAIGAIGSDLDISSSFEMQIVLSVVLLGIGFGPLILAPISEIKGRVPVLLLGNLFFLAWNVGCGFARTNTQLTIFRFLSGIGASAPLAIGGGVISDLWKPEERGKAMAVYTFGPLLGPALGPIAGGYITQRTTWRWVFWGVSIADCGLQIFALLFLHETYAPKILAKKARHLRRRTEDQTYHTEHEDPDKTLLKLIQNNLSRPLRMLGNQPVVQILALQMAILYGVMYMVLFTFPLLWTDIYHQSISRGSLNYISTGIGFILGSQSEYTKPRQPLYFYTPRPTEQPH